MKPHQRVGGGGGGKEPADKKVSDGRDLATLRRPQPPPALIINNYCPISFPAAHNTTLSESLLLTQTAFNTRYILT